VSAWVVFQRNVARLSIAAICALAAQEPKRRDDGGYDPAGGLGRPLAKSTTYRYLAEARESFREEYLKRPVSTWSWRRTTGSSTSPPRWAQVIRSARGAPRWQAAFDRHLRTLESRRKLLGLDQPVRVELTADITSHDDPASTKLAEAMADAKQRRDELMAEVTGDG
jgi:hypothetical protein